MSDGYKEMVASREHWDAKRETEIESLRSRLAEATEHGWWVPRADYDALAARLAEADALLEEVDATPSLQEKIDAHLSRERT